MKRTNAIPLFVVPALAGISPRRFWLRPVLRISVAIINAFTAIVAARELTPAKSKTVA